MTSVRDPLTVQTLPRPDPKLTHSSTACARALVEGNASLALPNAELETPALAACLWEQDEVLECFLRFDFVKAATVVQERARQRKRKQRQRLRRGKTSMPQSLGPAHLD